MATNNDSIIVEAFNEGEREVNPPNPQGKFFSEEEVAAIRRQEKDKLYEKIERESERVKTLEEQLAQIAQEREAAQKEAADRAAKEQELLRQREEQELSAKELLSRREEEWNNRLQQVESEFTTRLQELENQRLQQEAILEREREAQQIEAYRQRRIQEEQESIAPQLIDLISGNTQEEIEASVVLLKERSAAILESIQQSAPQSRLRGAPVTAPPTGPLENQTEYQTLTAEDIRNMPMDQYMKMRDRLLNAARPNRGRF